ncbi:pentapeptide repeat-containing protein [Methanosarcina mazei]
MLSDHEHPDTDVINLDNVNLNGARLINHPNQADFTNADLQNADFTGAFFLTFDQLSKARSLYNTKLDEDLANILKEKHPDLFETTYGNINLFRCSTFY